MGKKEFANQQPTQNLVVGRGRRGIPNTAHTKGTEVHSQLPTNPPPPGCTAELKFEISQEGSFLSLLSLFHLS